MGLAAKVLDRQARTERGIALGAKQVIHMVGLAAIASNIRRKDDALNVLENITSDRLEAMSTLGILLGHFSL